MTATAKSGDVSAPFRHIEDLQGSLPWGSFLDAGAGTHSMGWIGTLRTTRWTAVSGAEGHAVQVRDAIDPIRRPQDRIIVGNWADGRLLDGERYDTVLADYLLGAIEGFAPYFQEHLFARLRPHVGQRLYVVGLEPYVTSFPDNDAGRLVSAIGRYRDSCLLLAGERPYREYPQHWAAANLIASGYRLLDQRRFPIRYGQRFVDSQIDMSLMRLGKLENHPLAQALRDEGERLRQRGHDHIAAHGHIPCGWDYVIAAEPA